MRAGKLSKRITIYKKTEGQSQDFGSIQESYSKMCEVWAEVRYLSGREILLNDALVTSTAATFIIRIRPDISESMEIEYNGSRWNIQYMEEDTRATMLKLTASKIVNV